MSDTGLPQVRAKTFLDLDFDDLDMSATISWVCEAAVSDRFQYLVTPNVDHVARLHDMRQARLATLFADAVRHSDKCLNDSRVLALLARISGLRLDPVSGSDLTRELIARNVIPPGPSLILIGGTQAEANWLRGALPARKVLQFIPRMGVRDDATEQIRICEFVEENSPAVVLLAFGSPQSEMVAHMIQLRTKARGVCLCIGASVEFLSGTRRRAPPWMRRLALEWLYRLLSEPGRMWHRYLIRGPQIFLIWWKCRRSAHRHDAQVMPLASASAPPRTDVATPKTDLAPVRSAESLGQRSAPTQEC